MTADLNAREAAGGVFARSRRSAMPSAAIQAIPAAHAGARMAAPPPLASEGAEPIADAGSDETDSVAALRAGDEQAFVELVERLYRPLLGVAMIYLPSREIAEEVAQTWIAVLQGIAGFQERSSLRSWIFGILTNKAKTRGRRERRMLPLSMLVRAEASDEEAAVDPRRFAGRDEPWPGHWKTPPASWGSEAEQIVLAHETQELVASIIETLPPVQRVVVTLRDIEGWASSDVARQLEITPGNERVLLHRARTRIRAVLEEYIRDANDV